MRIFLAILLSLGVSFMVQADETWSVGKAEGPGSLQIYKFINEAPHESVRQKKPWLTVVSWKYDGSRNNGMPPEYVNKMMMTLEDSLEQIDGDGDVYTKVYSVTGNGLKEFVFYIADRDRFMNGLNQSLRGQPVYPIEIAFYEDKEWGDLANLHRSFDIAPE